MGHAGEYESGSYSAYFVDYCCCEYTADVAGQAPVRDILHPKEAISSFKEIPRIPFSPVRLEHVITYLLP